MNATSRIRAVLLGAWLLTAGVSLAQTPDSATLTNRTVVLLAKLRGVPEGAVKITKGAQRPGAFEIDISTSNDVHREATALSKELGSSAAVIVDRVSPDGQMRTNWTFRSGNVRQVVAPVGASGLQTNAQRMYVWPESASLNAPGRVRVRAAE